jgi:hypothetical protein
MEQAIDFKNQNIDQITKSTSWQITKPVRFIKNNKIFYWIRFRKNVILLKNSNLFDIEYYLNNNKDVKISGINPFIHFLKFGGIEKRDPGPNFDTEFYLKKYPDVSTAGLNPLIHYIKYGKQEDRKILPVINNDYFYEIKLRILGENPKNFLSVIDTSINSDELRLLLNEKFEGTAWPKKGETMIGYKRLTNIEYCLKEVIKNDIPGVVIETGVWRGGTCIFMKFVLDAYNVNDKNVWLADSFEGLPKPDTTNYPDDKGIDLYKSKELAISLEEVKNNFKKYNLLDKRVKFIKGWFKNTMPTAPISKLSILRLDGDLYQSTLEVLIHLYPKLSIGGYCIIDDWGAIPACRKAVEDYRKIFNIDEKIEIIDWTGVYWRKEKEVSKVAVHHLKELLKN